MFLLDFRDAPGAISAYDVSTFFFHPEETNVEGLFKFTLSYRLMIVICFLRFLSIKGTTGLKERDTFKILEVIE